MKRKVGTGKYPWIPDHPSRGCTCEFHRKHRIVNRDYARRKRGYQGVGETERKGRVGACWCGREVGGHLVSEWIYGCREMVR